MTSKTKTTRPMKALPTMSSLPCQRRKRMIRVGHRFHFAHCCRRSRSSLPAIRLWSTNQHRNQCSYIHVRHVRRHSHCCDQCVRGGGCWQLLLLLNEDGGMGRLAAAAAAVVVAIQGSRGRCWRFPRSSIHCLESTRPTTTTETMMKAASNEKKGRTATRPMKMRTTMSRMATTR